MQIEQVFHNDHSFYFCYDGKSFKMTTDSVLLSDFILFNIKDKLLVDYGVGLGTIPLLLASRTNIKMIGFEINPRTSILATETVKYNHLENQISIINAKIQDSLYYLEKNSVDIVVSNPPYFKIYEGSMLNKTEEKKAARHEIFLTFSELAKEANKVLKDQGKFVFVHRVDRLIEIIDILRENKLEPKRLKIVYDNKNSNAIIFLMEAIKNAKPGLKIETPFVLKETDYER